MLATDRTQGTDGRAVCPRGPPDAEIDSLRIQGGQGLEGFGNPQGRMVGQHHATRTHPNPLGVCSHVSD